MARRIRIHVNGHNIKKNKKTKGSGLPVFTVKDYKSNRKGNRVVILGPSELVFDLKNPMKSGAVAWIETYSDVDVYQR